MLAPLPDEPVFTVERRTVSEEAPRFLELPWRFLEALVSNFSATLVGAGGAGGGGGAAGVGIFGDDMHIILFLVK